MAILQWLIHPLIIIKKKDKRWKVSLFISGADPGIFVRGVHISKNFDKQKKMEREKTE